MPTTLSSQHLASPCTQSQCTFIDIFDVVNICVHEYVCVYEYALLYLYLLFICHHHCFLFYSIQFHREIFLEFLEGTDLVNMTRGKSRVPPSFVATAMFLLSVYRIQSLCSCYYMLHVHKCAWIKYKKQSSILSALNTASLRDLSKIGRTADALSSFSATSLIVLNICDTVAQRQKLSTSG